MNGGMYDAHLSKTFDTSAITQGDELRRLKSNRVPARQTRSGNLVLSTKKLYVFLYFCQTVFGNTCFVYLSCSTEILTL